MAIAVRFLSLFLFSLLTAAFPYNLAPGTLLGSSFGVPGESAEFDYIVVGGGTAGNAIAARLAENPNITVAVIEAGGFYELDNGNGSVIPGLCNIQFLGTEPNNTNPLIDWGFVTTPQAGAADRRMHYASGKTFGGGTARNYMIFHRGTIGAYQLWANQVGDQNYTFGNLLPYFDKGMNLSAPDESKRQPNATVSYDPAVLRSKGGPLHVSWPNWAAPIATWMQKALADVGLPESKSNFLSGALNGSSYSPVTVDPQYEHRETSETSYLAQAIESTSLKVYAHTVAERILFQNNSQGPKASGIVVNTAGEAYTLTAKKEVIVSAGAFKSPQLLMVSGIGPGSTLKAHNITPVSILEGVGQNLWDQPFFGISRRVNVITGSETVNNPAYGAQITEDYLSNQTGLLTSPPDFIAFEKLPTSYRANLTRTAQSQLAAYPSDWPELEYLAINGALGYGENPAMADPHDGHNYGGIAVALIAPTSRGNVTISSSSIQHPPVINPNWLSTQTDAEVAVAAFRRIRTILTASNITIGPEYLPGPQVQSDEDILQFIRESMTPIWHASATCKMGMRNDSSAVIDTQARVYGVQGLRVVDASSFPFLPPGHPQATVYALAEKIADDIKMGR